MEMLIGIHIFNLNPQVIYAKIYLCDWQHQALALCSKRLKAFCVALGKARPSYGASLKPMRTSLREYFGLKPKYQEAHLSCHFFMINCSINF
jgi:hypothetical protein